MKIKWTPQSDANYELNIQTFFERGECSFDLYSIDRGSFCTNLTREAAQEVISALQGFLADTA